MPCVERARAVRPRPPNEEPHDSGNDDPGRDHHPDRKAPRRRHDLDRSGVDRRLHRFCRRRSHRPAGAAIGRVTSAVTSVDERRVELENGGARGIQVAVVRTIARVLHAIAHRLKFGERVGLIEVDELALARFANQRLAREDACCRRACGARLPPRPRSRSDRRRGLRRRDLRRAGQPRGAPRRARRAHSAVSGVLTERSGGAPLRRCRG